MVIARLMAMDKKRFIAAITIAGILLSIVAVQFVEVAEANFISPYGPFPTIYPSAIIQYPINGTTYKTSTLNCLFSTITPDWAGFYSDHWVSIYLDNRLLQTFFNPATSYVLANLTNGQHYFVVEAGVKYAYLSTTYRSGCGSVNFTIQAPSLQPSITITPSSSSQNIEPTQTPTPTSSPSPSPIPAPSISPTLQPTLEPTLTTIASIDYNYPMYILVGIIVLVVALSALTLYFRKRRK
jgi:hypothetical protein